MTTKEVTVENALRELSGVAWPRLLFALDIDRRVETRITEECGVDETAAMGELLKHWLDNDEDATWEKLAKALMSQPPFTRTGAYIYNKYVNNEDLTADLICQELDFVKDWFTLAYPFLYDSQRIKDAVINIPVERRRNKLMEVWLEFDDEPSWEKVARAVEDCFPEHEERADKIRTKYLPKVEFRHPGNIEDEKDKSVQLDPKSAFTHTGDINDWYALGWFLGLDEDNLNEVERKHFRNDDRRQAVLELWLENKQSASWYSLGRALRTMPQHIGLSQRTIRRSIKEKEKTQVQERMEKIVEESREEINPVTTLTRVENLKSYLGGIQAAINAVVHLNPEISGRIQQALRELSNELDVLDSEMRMKETDSQIAVSTSISTSESDPTDNLGKLQDKVKELEGELQKKDNEVTILKTRSLNKDREVDLLKHTINQQKKQPDVVKYYSHVFYKFNQHQKEWEIVFVTVQDDPKYIQLVMKMYSDYLKDVYQILELDENATHLQLRIDISSIYPWEMNELTTAEIDINEINNFLPESSRVPHCHFKFCWLSEIHPPKLLKMKFHLIGTKGPNNFFYIFLPRDNIPDAVSILDEMVFTFNENTETTFKLPEYDLCINVPEGSVTQKTEMYIRPVLTGDFKLPPGCHQVSGIYQIECSEKLEKDISLRMGHYAVVDSQEEYANFGFYSASASTGPPYVFEKVESNSFVVDNMTASITLRHFCFFGSFWFGRSNLRYCSQMFYKTFSNALCDIEMLFVVTENEHTVTEFVKESYKERGYVEYADQMIKFKKGETSLKVKPENEELDTWRMTAKQNPEIKKDEIDDFKPKVSGSIPHCCYSFGWPSTSSPTPLSVKFNLIGADDSNSYFNVDLHITGSSQYSISHGSLTADTNSQTSSSSSQDASPYNIFKARMSKMLEVVSNPDTDRLANDLSLADLIPYSVKDHVITSNLDRYRKASDLFNEIERSLRNSNKPEDLKTFCEILKKLDNPSLTRIADEILKKLKNKITHPLSPGIHPPTKRLRDDEEQEEEEEEEEKGAEEKIEEREVMRKRKRTKKSKENQVKRRK